jgi:microcystin-dependent protein
MDEPIIGEIRLSACDRIPAGWASCDGQILSISEHRALFDVIGNRYGGDGRRTFALPDLRGRVAIHADDQAYPLGASGGSARHTLTVEELPAHSHDLFATAVNGTGYIVANEAGSQVSADVVDGVVELSAAGAFGVATHHENMQPYLGVMFVIALVGHSPTPR